MNADTPLPVGTVPPKGKPAREGRELLQTGRSRVSVIIPVYNAAEFVSRAVSSALQQPEVLEVVLVEDGSPDNSLAVCRELAHGDTRVRVLRHPGGANRGAGASRNLGITSAAGNLLAFLDADDYYLPGRFGPDIRLLDDQPSLDGVYNAIGTQFYDEAGRARYADKGKDDSELTTMKCRLDPEGLFLSMAPVGSLGHFHADGLTVHRRVFDVLDGFDPDLELSQDTLLFLQMALKCRLGGGRLDEPVAMRGVHTGNRVADEEKLRRFRVVLFGKLYAWMRREGVDASVVGRIWELYYQHAAANYAGPEPIYLAKHMLMHPELLVSRTFWQKVFGKLAY